MTTDQRHGKRNGSVRRLRLRAAYLVLSVFTVSIVVDMASSTYESPPGLVALTAVVGVWLFGARSESGEHD